MEYKFSTFDKEQLFLILKNSYSYGITIHYNKCNKYITKQPNSYAIGISITLQCLLQSTKRAHIVIIVIVINLWLRYLQTLIIYIDYLIVQVLGAFWYLFSTQRLTACWHKAFENRTDGFEISFNCGQSSSSLSFLDDFCPIDSPNTSTFNFGIFLEARRSGILESTGFLQKVFYCFWWGMRNLRFAHIIPFTIPYLYYSISIYIEIKQHHQDTRFMAILIYS